MTRTTLTDTRGATPTLSEDERKSLELLQGIITRLSTNSFLLKGWAVTLVAGILTLSGEMSPERAAKFAMLPAVVFWILDAYLLAREHQYRERFEKGRCQQAQPYDFRLETLTTGQWLRAAFLPTIVVLYLPVLLMVLAVTRKWL